MGWPFQFLELSEAEKHLRRQELDRYAGLAQLSALLPVAVALVYRVASRAVKSPNGAYAAIPSYPERKDHRRGSWQGRLQKTKWWLGGDVVAFGNVRGQRDQWIFGVFYLGWLILLCLLDTHRDYLHLTKRFGIVAASQFPIQYLMALKSLNPFAYVFHSSHEQVNRFHRVLGIVIYTLLCLHVVFYLNFFVHAGILKKRLLAPVVAFGVMAFVALSLLNTTALQPIRRYSYRLFFFTHLFVAFAMPPLLFLHAMPAKYFMVEALGVFIADIASRKMDTVITHATLESIPGTNLVKITASVPHTKINRFRQHPGSHIYLNLPAAAREAHPASAAHLVFEFLFNPFTVAGVDPDNGDLTLVARHRGGPMTAALGRLARASSSSSSPFTSSGAGDEDRKFPLAIEGPYGTVTRLNPLVSGEFDRILLVAGGIGATFTVPLYRSLVNDNPSAKVEMVWAIQTAGDATWAAVNNNNSNGNSNEVQSILNDENVHIFLTRNMGMVVRDSLGSSRSSGNSSAAAAVREQTTRGRWADSVGEGSRVDEGNAGDTEMSAMYRDRRRNRYTTQHNRKRPDLKKMVDDLFRNGQEEERVAVVVCGPEEMARELRRHVSGWVMKGRDVWWHSEGFGF